MDMPGWKWDLVVGLPFLVLTFALCTFAAWQSADKKRRKDRLAKRARMRGSL